MMSTQRTITLGIEMSNPSARDPSGSVSHSVALWDDGCLGGACSVAVIAGYSDGHRRFSGVLIDNPPFVAFACAVTGWAALVRVAGAAPLGMGVSANSSSCAVARLTTDCRSSV